MVFDNVHDLLSIKDGVSQSVKVLKKELKSEEATHDTIVNKNFVDKQTEFVCKNIKDIVFGSLGPFENVSNEGSGDDTILMVEESTLVFPTTFVRLEFDIEFGSYNRHKKGKGDIELPSDTSSVSKGSKLIVHDKFVSGELNIEFGTFGHNKKDHNEIKDLKDDEKVSREVDEDMDSEVTLDIQNYLIKALKLDQENKSLPSYKKDRMETRSFGSCGDLAALYYLCSNKARRFVGQWISDDEYCKTIETRKTGSCVEERPLSDDLSDKKVAGENTRIMMTEEHAKHSVKSEIMDLKEEEENEIDSKLKEQCLLKEMMEDNEAIEENKRKAEEARNWAVVRDKKEAEQTEMVEKFLGQITNDVARNLVPIENDMRYIPTVSTVETQNKFSCFEEKNPDDHCNEKVAGNNKQLTKAKESAKSIVGRGTIDNTEEEKVYEISKEEIVSKLKVQHWLVATMKEQVAEEAQMQAEVQAEKEAKKKEKARLKRLRKKEKKKAGVSNSNINDQDVAESNGSNELHKANETEPQRLPSQYLSKRLKFKTIVSPSTVKLAMKKMVLLGTLVLALFSFTLISTN